MKPKTATLGFTLLEMVFTILILGIIATLSASLMRGNADSEKYEATRQKMEVIRAAILGSSQLDSKGQKSDFGYHGDVGDLPPSLPALTAPQVPAWAYVATYGFGAGWKGPYFVQRAFDPYPISTDAWGNALVYSTTSVTSYGSDGVVNGISYASDLILPLSTADRLARVRGVVRDGSVGLASKTVRLLYPAAGVVVTASATTDASGFFTFSNIPYGQRAVLVTDAPGIGASPVTVAAPEVFLPADTLNYYGSAQKITVDTSTAGCTADRLQHRVSVSSSYANVTTLGYLTVWWESTAAMLNTITLNSTAQSLGSVTSGSRITITKTMTLPVGSPRDLTLRWSQKTDSDTVSAEMEWTGIADKDQISWVTTTCANPNMAVNNPRSSSFSGSRTLTTMAYTVPAGTNDALLVVVAGASDANNNVKPASATYTGSAMTLVTSGIGGSAGTRAGTGMFWLAVTAGQSGNVVVTYPGAAIDHLVFAASLNSADPSGPEAKALNTSGITVTSASVTAISDYGMVMSGGEMTSTNQTYATGTNGAGLHVLDIEDRTGGTSGGMGHVSVSAAQSVQGVGFTAKTATNAAVAAAAFKYKP